MKNSAKIVMPDFNQKEIEKRLGVTFQDGALLRRCFVHSSYAAMHKGEVSNEKLEFLGDAVLELIFSERLYFSSGDEGILTSRRQRFVSDESLEKAVRKTGLQEFLLVGGKDNVGKKAVPSLLEAIIAAIYLDGGYEKARSFVLNHVEEEGEFNFVGALQEICQRGGEELPSYEFFDEGEEGNPLFLCRVKAKNLVSEGRATSKKEARREAAKALYSRIKKE